MSLWTCPTHHGLFPFTTDNRYCPLCNADLMFATVTVEAPVARVRARIKARKGRKARVFRVFNGYCCRWLVQIPHNHWPSGYETFSAETFPAAIEVLNQEIRARRSPDHPWQSL